METIASLFDGLEVPPMGPRFNIAPTQRVACMRSLQGRPVIGQLRWGLVPSWSKDLSVGAKMINARAETIASKPSFRSAFRQRRCLVIADGFFEWKKIGKNKFPFYIRRPDSKPFCMAGLWEQWRREGQAVETCTIITTTANAALQSLHDRMPVILRRQAYPSWLDPKFNDLAFLERQLVPVKEGELQMQEVSRIVNNAGNDFAACVEPEPTLFD